MPVIEFRAKEGKGWQPLPKGTYTLQINSVDPTKVSKAGNNQMMVEAQVTDGDHAGKKCTLWYPLDGKAAWRLRNLLEATDINYEETDTGEVEVDDGKELKIYGYSFDTDDLPGASFTCDVDIREYEGKKNNDYANERKVGEAVSKPANGGKPAAAAAPAARTPTAAAASTAGAQRRPRV